ncbi:MAG: hypothetical protein Q9172_005835 [Xanthocarpia lactea]
MAELLGENPTSSFNLLPTLESCDCEEHAFDFFCPQSLVQYRSMDIPAMMTFLSSQNHVDPEKIKLEEGDKSKRLEQEVLEHYWGRRSPGPQMKLPFWANADGVVQRIIHQDEYRNASTSLSPSPRLTASLLYNEPASGSPSLEGSTTTLSTRSSTGSRSENQAFRPETPLSELSQSRPADHHKDERRPIGQSGKLVKPDPKKKAGVAARRSSRNSRVTKTSWRPAMRLRSSQVTKFYELAWNGSAIFSGH